MTRFIHFVRQEAGLCTILLGFFLLTVSGIFYNFGLPGVVGDETPPLVASLKMIGDQTLRPAFPTFYYMPLAAYAVLPFALVGVVTLPFFGIPSEVSTIKEFVVLHYANLLPLARLASIVYALLAIILLYHIARRIFGRQDAALLSAFFFSTSLLFIQLAHLGRVWSVQILAIMIALWAIMRLFESPTRRNYLFVALGIAFSFGVNVIGALVYVPFVFAHNYLNRGKSFVARFLVEKNFLMTHVALFLALLVFYYLNPYGFANYLGYIGKFFSSVSSDATTLSTSFRAPTCGDGQFASLYFYPRILLEYDLPLVLFSLLGIFVLWKNRIEKGRMLFATVGVFAGAYTIGITALSYAGINNCEPRYILPIVPVLALLAGFGMSSFLEGKGKRARIMLIVIALIAMLYGPVLFDMKFTLPSTRLLAREWIFTNIPRDTRIAVLDDTLDLPENTQTRRDIKSYAPLFFTIKRDFLTTREEVRGAEYYVLTAAYFKDGIPEQLRERPNDYLVISWWNAKDREERLMQASAVGFGGDQRELIARFPIDATDKTESIDLPNNMRAPLLRLPALKQNGPVIDVYKLR